MELLAMFYSCNQKQKKGKKIVVDEMQLCCLFFHVSQDLVINNGQKSVMFWDRLQNHFNELHPISCAPKFVRSLETKWGIINHDVAKFIGNYTIMLALCESMTGFEDTFHKASNLYKITYVSNVQMSNVSPF